MANKELQRERMKGYFIEAAKNIILDEGVDGMTVRRVAEDAGYGYTTLYNYFENLNDLLWQTSMSIMQGLEVQVSGLDKEASFEKRDLVEMVLIYMHYMFDNPNVFKLFFMYEFDQHDGAIEIVPYEPVFPRMLAKVLTQFAEQGIIEPHKIKLTSEIIIFSIHGLLTMSLSGRADVPRDAAIGKIQEIINEHIQG